LTDAFGSDLKVGDRVMCIANLISGQTFFIGRVVQFVGQCASVQIEKVSNLCIEESKAYSPLNEKRICTTHRLAKL
jgi:hypothetical protein